MCVGGWGEEEEEEGGVRDIPIALRPRLTSLHACVRALGLKESVQKQSLPIVPCGRLLAGSIWPRFFYKRMGMGKIRTIGSSVCKLGINRNNFPGRNEL